MFHFRTFSPRIGLLAVASLLLASGVTFAHGGGGGHGGGGHGGGAHVGGVHVGGVHVGGVGVGGFHRGGIGTFYGSGFSRGLGYANGALLGRGYGLGYGLGYSNVYGRGYGLGLPYGAGIGLGRGYGLGLYGLGYGRYGYGFGGGYGYPYGYSYGNGYGYGTPAVGGYASYYPSAVPQQQPAQQEPVNDNTAHLLVVVPENATLTFNGSETSQTGAQREFVTPPLEPGKRYSYEVKVRWTENGKPVEQARTVHVQANAWQVVDFTKPEMPAAPQD
jgi:uncharacterized protein (TIGR03000 family)